MAQVTLQINGRGYAVGCDEGEQAHLVELARYVDLKVRDLAGKVGAVGEARLLLLACLTLADELEGATAELDGARERVDEGAGAGARAKAAEAHAGDVGARLATMEKRLAERDGALAGRLDTVAKRIATLADRLARA